MNFAHRQTEEEPDLETIPSATTPKRNREGNDIPMEPMGDTKRMHVDSRVTVANQFFEPIPQHGMRVEPPEDIGMDPSVQPVIAQPKPAETLTAKLTQLTMDIQSDNEEFIKRHRIWSPSETPVQSSAMGSLPRDELPLDLAVRHCMHGWPTFDTLYGHPNDPTLPRFFGKAGKKVYTKVKLRDDVVKVKM